MTHVVLGLPSLRRAPASALPQDRPADPRLVDRFGRVATDLRVSLTDRCNLRCSYCMPAEGLEWLADERLLTDDEIVRLIRIAVDLLGVEEVRFTGGEPLLRRGLERIVAATTDLRTASGETPHTAVTTNALGLAKRARPLAEAGLRRVNVSIDTLDRSRFARITHRDRLPDVLAGLRAAADAGLTPVKLNTVLLRGVNDDEAVPLARFALDNGYELRFIEQMPLDPQGAWSRAEMITAEEILASLRTAFTVTPADPLPEARPPPRRGSSTTGSGTASWASWGRSRGPSAATATGPASRRTARCATACSRAVRPTCGRCCAQAPRTPSSPTPGAATCGRSAPATGSTTRRSCSRRVP